jgi:hypothetical protein
VAGGDLTQTIVASIVGLLGIRMLVLAGQRRSLPELWIGVFFLTTGVGAECFLRSFSRTTEAQLAQQLAFVGFAVLFLSTLSSYLFTYTVFRRGESWAVAVVCCGSLFALWGTLQQLGGLSLKPDMGGPQPTYLAGRFLCFAWSAFEAFRAYRMARRRLALGLADRVVVNRFFLFGTCFGLQALMPITYMLSRNYGSQALQDVSNLPPKLIGLGMVVTLILTFLPPRKYLEWVRGATNEEEQ